MHKSFGDTSQGIITILVDNRADLIVKSTDEIRYFTKKPLLAEHGFAALVDLPEENFRILWDTGLTPLVLIENMKRMEIDPASIQKIALSHGHDDHTAGLADFLRWMDRRPKPEEWGVEVSMDEISVWSEMSRVPVIAHPAAFRERWSVDKDGKKYGPMQPPPRLEWESLGAEVILSEEPYELGRGCWTTGTVPHLSSEKSGRSSSLYYRQESDLIHDNIEDDQALVVNVKNKGLVILSGCAHSGIVNTINRARQISGVERVWAVLGGFHLAGADEDELRKTVDALKEFQPARIVPSHCTGFHAQCRLAAEMGDVFTPGVVGASFFFK
jgi:7,8-dihydropterin-6-yl-methyl-4-(beta-D-ribofuranosyl)aminobenzene 5'-phosphate synthase